MCPANDDKGWQYDLTIVTVPNPPGSLEELSREIATPIGDIRMLPMETVLLPNQALDEETNRRLREKGAHGLTVWISM